ncbi:MAG TPA: glycosyltransferase [Thermodesulfobacteriota bacterium]|nr:glycosyltransferase [Thermodesulfobacteriota bacterium]
MSPELNRLKVVYLLDLFPALSETFILNEVIELTKQGVDVSVFALSKPTEEIVHPEAEELANKTYYLDGLKKLSRFRKVCFFLYVHIYFLVTSPLKYLKACSFAYSIGSFKYLLTRFRNSIYYAYQLRGSEKSHMHVHFASTASEYAMLISILSGIPYSFTVHAYDIFQRFSLMREKIKTAKFVVAVSLYNKNYIKKRCPGIDENKIHVVHCGVDLQKLANQGSVIAGGGDRPFAILSVGRLIEKKGHIYLLDACRTIVNRGISDFICQIVGDGPLGKELEGRILKLDLSDKVHLTGSLPSERVLQLIGEADLFILPCVVARDGDMDGIPVSLMEAMALGKPVISTHISGIPELVKDSAGILVPPADPEALADAIEEIYQMDPQKRNELGMKGREIIESEFNIKKEVEKLKTLFISYSKQDIQSLSTKN